KGSCRNRECLTPTPCPNLNLSHAEYLDLLRSVRALPGVKKVFIRSGIRFDYLLQDPDPAFFKELVAHHVSGQLKVAPEHISPRVLSLMNKPGPEAFFKFQRRFEKENKRLGKKQFLVPYFISSHPGSTLEDAIDLALFFHRHRLMPEQVQDFYPTPGTLATCMYHTGLDPRTMEPVFVPKNLKDKAMQRALLHYRNPKNRSLVREALLAAGRRDLIGFGPDCLLRPERRRKPPRK
ncbi:MAG TPA: DUF3362 domain-containing protein, partial [Spirochaetia bacterium]|nr:DUF3362 domain-containing protein [Spirochaetia bacterium]